MNVTPIRVRIKVNSIRAERYLGSTVDGFIFVGTNILGLNENDTFMGLKIRGHSIFLPNSYKKTTYSWVLEFVDRTLHEIHENWYPMKIKPSTVIESMTTLQKGRGNPI